MSVDLVTVNSTINKGMDEMFKIGDKVKCVSDDDGGEDYLKKGEVYIVKRVSGGRLTLEGQASGPWDQTRFELVEDTITVTIPYEMALDYLQRYPHSKYLRPAVEAAGSPKTPFPASTFPIEEYPIGTVIEHCGNSLVIVGRNLAVIGTSKDRCETTIASNSPVHNEGTVVYVPSVSDLTEITFSMPLSVAREFNDCTVAPLVRAYDLEHKPLPEVGDYITRTEAVALPKNWILTYNPGEADPQAIITNGTGGFNRSYKNGGDDHAFIHARGMFLVLWKPEDE